MARKRENRRSRHMRKVFLVICEGETEETYIDFLRQSFRSPIKIVTKISGTEISKRKIDQYRNDLKIYGNEVIETFLMYDMDVPAIVNKLKQLNAELLLSNPCIELWFLLHCVEVHTEVSSTECFKRLITSHSVWSNYQKPILSLKQRELLWSNKEVAILRACVLAEFSNPSSSIFKLLNRLKRSDNT